MEVLADILFWTKATVGIGLIGFIPIGFIFLVMYGFAFVGGKSQPINGNCGELAGDHTDDGHCASDGGDCGGGDGGD